MQIGKSRYGAGQVLSALAIRTDGAQISAKFTILPFTGETGEMIGIAAIMREATARFELRNIRRQLASFAPEPA